jgi:DNA-binding NarL/FixJ family response regulator
MSSGMSAQPSEKKRIRILSVDDSADIRVVFELLMREHPEFVTVGCLNVADALEEHVAKLQPDVVVLDLSMPGRDPLEAVAQTRAKFPHVRFLISTAYDDAVQIEKAILAGATGYLLKEGDFDQLADAIRRVAAGETVCPRGGQRRLMRNEGPI